jgi:uncharacterized protein with PIN domain
MRGFPGDRGHIRPDAILLQEPASRRLAEALAAADEALISAASLVELCAVADSRHSPASPAPGV